MCVAKRPPHHRNSGLRSQATVSIWRSVLLYRSAQRLGETEDVCLSTPLIEFSATKHVGARLDEVLQAVAQ